MNSVVHLKAILFTCTKFAHQYNTPRHLRGQEEKRTCAIWDIKILKNGLQNLTWQRHTMLIKKCSLDYTVSITCVSYLRQKGISYVAITFIDLFSRERLHQQPAQQLIRSGSSSLPWITESKLMYCWVSGWFCTWRAHRGLLTDSTISLWTQLWRWRNATVHYITIISIFRSYYQYCFRLFDNLICISDIGCGWSNIEHPPQDIEYGTWYFQISELSLGVTSRDTIPSGDTSCMISLKLTCTFMVAWI